MRSKQKGRPGAKKEKALGFVLGGALGGLVGMRTFHHKTKHWYFRFGFPLLLIIQLALGIWLVWRFRP